MVSNPRKPSDTHRIRRLNSPRQLEVEASPDGAPLRLRTGSQWQDVTLVRRPWRIDQHWWRPGPLRRDYFRVAVEDGPPMTIFHDTVSGQWARQEY